MYPVPGSGDCMGTGGHFDPMKADYAGSEAPLPYEYGDLSGKWGKLNAPSAVSSNPAAKDFFVGTGQGFVSDATLPLSGSMSVLGRSIVIHKANGDRWACATFQPYSSPTFTPALTLALAPALTLAPTPPLTRPPTSTRWACATIPMRIRVIFPDLGPSYPRGSILMYQVRTVVPVQSSSA